jgi:hypothetical protein
MRQTCFLLPVRSLNHIFNRSQLRWYNYRLFHQVETGNLGNWAKIGVIYQRTRLSNQFGLCQHCPTVIKKMRGPREIIRIKKTEKAIVVDQKHLLFPLRLLNDTKCNFITTSSIHVVHLFSISIAIQVRSVVCPCKIKN